jgi:hypothetical protein
MDKLGGFLLGLGFTVLLTALLGPIGLILALLLLGNAG